MNAAEVAALAALESRELQLTKVASILKAPIAAAARSIDALRIKLAEGAPAAPAEEAAPAEAPAAEEAPAEAAPVAEEAAAEAPAEAAAETETPAEA